MEKITITLPAKTIKFLEQYRKEHSLKSQSDVIEVALATLQELEHEDDLSEAPDQEELDDLGDLEVTRFERHDAE